MEAERQQESKLHPNLSVEEKLYFGSVVVGFVAVGGASFAYAPNESFAEGNPNDEVLKKISIDRLQPAYSNLILPAIPAVDVVPISTDNKQGTRLCFAHMMVPRLICTWPCDPAPSSLLPELFRQPLLKSEEGSPVAVGVQSGRRSALLKTDGKWHRLKGMHLHPLQALRHT